MFVCTASIIYRSPDEKSWGKSWCFFLSFFLTDTDVSQGKQGTIFGSLYQFHEHSGIDLQFCIMFNTYKHLRVSGKQKYTMAVWYNVYINKEFLSVITEAIRGIPRKHCLPNPCLFIFLIFTLKSNPSRNTVVRYSILIQLFNLGRHFAGAWKLQISKHFQL